MPAVPPGERPEGEDEDEHDEPTHWPNPSPCEGEIVVVPKGVGNNDEAIHGVCDSVDGCELLEDGLTLGVMVFEQLVTSDVEFKAHAAGQPQGVHDDAPEDENVPAGHLIKLLLSGQ